MEISESAVIKIITSQRHSKAKDAYGLHNTFLKSHKESLACPIAHLINLSIRHSLFPSPWQKVVMSPVFKSGDKITNYRPINILSVISKVCEKWVAEQLTAHLNLGNAPLHPMQFGFRTNQSTETANCYFLESVKFKLDKGGVAGAVCLDFKFDTVNH